MVPIPASRLPPPRSRPRTGSWPTQTPARWPRKQSRASSSPVSRVIGLPEHPLEPAEQPGAVVGVPQRGGGQGHHHVDSGLLGGGLQPAHRADRRGRPVGGHAAGAGHLGPEMEERPAAQHRRQDAVPGGVHHHQMERAAAQVEDGYAHGRHRRDATGIG